MKRILTLFACIILLAGCLCIPVSAESAASSVNLMCTVNSEGDCFATMTVNLRLEAATDKLYFPLPLNAKNITLGGSPASTTKSSAATLVDISKLSRDYVGELALRFEYTIPEAVQITKFNEGTISEEWRLLLTIPLLSGFDYPVENLSFTITMPPGQMTNRPTLTSIYRQASIESDIPFQMAGSQIIGSAKTVMNDHEGVTLTMIVPESMFPTVSTYFREGNPELPYIIAFAVLALLYWILTLRTWPIIRTQTTTPPEGITAGELGCRLTLSGGDLTMMVFSWAQLGYLLIHLDDNGRVMLHKRMEMGNERSSFEVKTFQRLFGKKRMVDGTGYQYARLCRSVARKTPGKKAMCRKGVGNTKIFRFLACGIHLFFGICVAMNLTGIAGLQIVLSIFLSALAVVSAWLIQGGMFRIHLRYKLPLLLSLGLGILWILIGVLSGPWLIAIVSVLAQMAAGLAAAYGGRRSDLGRQNACQILGLRQYLRKITGEELKRIQKNDPEYFFNLIPFAMAMGVGKAFAKGFGGKKLPPCPYFVCGVHSKMMAEDWYRFMHEAAETLDYRQRRMELEKLLSIRVR